MTLKHEWWANEEADVVEWSGETRSGLHAQHREVVTLTYPQPQQQILTPRKQFRIFLSDIA